MGVYRNLIDRLVARLLRSNEYESTAIRSYFYRHHRIEIGLYSIGAFDRWRIPPGTRIGRYCSIAKTARLLDADHPTDALSTHPYFYLKGLGVVAEDRARLVPPVVEDDVWIGHNAIVTPACHRVGRGAIIGAGAVVMADVPPYAIMVGAPARLARFRFTADVIASIEASQWWTLGKTDLAAAVAAAPDFAARPDAASAAAFVAASRVGSIAAAVPPVAPVATAAHLSTAHRDRLLDLLAAEIPDFTPALLNRPFADLGIDSFALISLRSAAEQLLGGQIVDRVWGAIVTPADILALAGRPVMPVSNDTIVDGGHEQRLQVVNMPQMALQGLSESWLLKELGDIHWNVLTHGLGKASADVADSEGNRLYATFTRLCVESEVPLTAFRENETIVIDLAATRYGAGMFFGEASVAGEAGTARVQLMTSFSKFGEAGANTSLLKGQPAIPDSCTIPALAAPPPFAQEYRARRSADLPPPIFECDYEILPPHDINGVGLLYFAAYPMIIDLCAMRFGGREMLFDFSTVFRDICYFANAMPDETLRFRLHEWHADAARIRFSASLARAGDGKTMAHVITEKVASLR